MTSWLGGRLGFEGRLSLEVGPRQEVATRIKGTRRYKGVAPSTMLMRECAFESLIWGLLCPETCDLAFSGKRAAAPCVYRCCAGVCNMYHLCAHWRGCVEVADVCS